MEILMKRAFLLLLFALHATTPSFAISVTRQFFWTDPGGIAAGSDDVKRADTNSTSFQTIVPGLKEPRGMALDLVNQKLYVSDVGAGVIRRSNLDGSGLEIFTAIHNAAAGVVVDSIGGKVYWTDAENVSRPTGQIRRA